MILKMNKAFRHLFLSRISSVLADAVMFFSLLKWIELQTGNSDSFTFFYVAFYLPVAFLALPIGAWISNKTLQKVMIISTAIQAMVLFVFLTIMPFVTYQWLYGFLVILSILALFFVPANQALLPYIVEENHRPQANGALQLGLTGVKMVGQIFTAFIIKIGINPEHLLIIAGILMLLSLVFTSRIKPAIKETQNEEKSQWRLIKEGVRYITHNRVLRSLFVFLTLGMFIVSSIDLLLIHFLTDMAGVGVENLSFIGTASLTGITIGSLLTPRWYKKTNEKKWLLLPLFFTLSISIGSLSFIQNWLYILPFFTIQGVALGCFNISFITYLQEIISSENYTRTFSFYHMLSSAVALPGVLLIGMLLTGIGAVQTMIAMSFFLACLGIGGIVFIPQLRTEIVKQSA